MRLIEHSRGGAALTHVSWHPMRTMIIPKHSTSSDTLRLVERPEPQLRPYQVLVRIRAAALNYRDLAVASGR
jgi:NADPH:quinone reductase-like Zn-dependent oxidoreductase